jgi:xanthine permease XanP
MQPDARETDDLIYGLNDRPRPAPALLAATQHVLAAFVGIITPPLIIGSALGLGAYMPYLISMALMVSGVGTFIQARRPFGIGAGMICLQGTSFAFLGAVLSAGFMVKQRGGSAEDIMAMVFGCVLLRRTCADRAEPLHWAVAPCDYSTGHGHRHHPDRREPD